MTRELTGRHVLIIVVSAFAVIIAANMTMLFAATGSFPGLVVGNSYVAGQGWDKRADAQRALGWSADVAYQDGTLRIVLADSAGRPVRGIMPKVTIGRPTTDADDLALDLTVDGAGFAAPVDLTTGRWRVAIATEEPEPFTTTAEIYVQGAD